LQSQGVAGYNLVLLPPIKIGCSHEHAGYPRSISISSTTLHTIVSDVMRSLEQSGIHKLAIVNGHGGNYVLSNIVQEANVPGPRMVLFPHSLDWRDARTAAGCETTNHDDMHGGEAETSILLAEAPELVGDSYRDADHIADDRRLLLTTGWPGTPPTESSGCRRRPPKRRVARYSPRSRGFQRTPGPTPVAARLSPYVPPHVHRTESFATPRVAAGALFFCQGRARTRRAR
jgi:creatinine amidohydrolase